MIFVYDTVSGSFRHDSKTIAKSLQTEVWRDLEQSSSEGTTGPLACRADQVFPSAHRGSLFKGAAATEALRRLLGRWN